jgi:translation elongation factor P/translation initiation factor 5A
MYPMSHYYRVLQRSVLRDVYKTSESMKESNVEELQCQWVSQEGVGYVAGGKESGG